MNQVADEVLNALRAVWRRRWIAVATAWVAAIVGIVVIKQVPDRYEASARIYVDTQTVLKPLMQGLAFQPDTDQQLKMLARTIVSRPNIQQMIKHLGTDVSMKGEDTEHTIDRLVERIKVDSSGGNLYVVSFRDTYPQRAKAVVAGLVDLFVVTGMGSEQKDSAEAGNFINDQIKIYEQKLSEAEGRLKDFKLRNFSVSGVSSSDYFTRTAQAADEVTRLKIAYAAAERSRDALRRELSGEDPQLPPEAAAANGLPAAPSELDTRITEQKRQLDELLRKYTDQHPDVIAARNTIRSLEAQRAAEKADKASGKSSGSAATSPVFQQIRVQLAQAEANVASLGSQLAAQQQRLDELHATATKVPAAEAELAQLNRDYDVIRHNYEQLVSRRESASLGVKMDQSAQLADFRVIEPPRVLPKPVFPDRFALAGAAMLASLALGIALAYGLSLLYPTFASPRALQELTKRPVIGTISVYASAETMAARGADLRRIGLAMAAFFIVQAVWLAWVLMHRNPTL
jgi:polysaccharide chain length determinant protein (PEP-CTERM system associated)